MATCNSDLSELSSSECDSSQRDESFVEFEENTEITYVNTGVNNTETDSEHEIAYADEPIADAEWLSEYNQQMKATEEQEAELKSRLEGTAAVSTW